MLTVIYMILNILGKKYDFFYIHLFNTKQHFYKHTTLNINDLK